DRPVVEAEDGMPAIESGAVTGRVNEAPVLGVGDLGPVDGERMALYHAARPLVFVAAVAAENEWPCGNLDQRIARNRIAAGRGGGDRGDDDQNRQSSRNRHDSGSLDRTETRARSRF